MKSLKFSKFTWVMSTFDVCGDQFLQLFFRKGAIDHHISRMTLEASELCGYFGKFPPPHNLSKFPWMLAGLTEDMPILALYHTLY